MPKTSNQFYLVPLLWPLCSGLSALASLLRPLGSGPSAPAPARSGTYRQIVAGKVVGDQELGRHRPLRTLPGGDNAPSLT